MQPGTEARDLAIADLPLLKFLESARENVRVDPTEAQALINRACDALRTRMGMALPCDDVSRAGFTTWRKKRVEAYVLENLSEHIAVDELAEVIKLSRSHFTRLFRRSFGLSPRAYIIEQRLKKARCLMVRTREALSAIAVSCGFADQAHFSKLFRQRLGTSPAAWRREQTEDFSCRRHQTADGWLQETHFANSSQTNLHFSRPDPVRPRSENYVRV
jgi:AraC family transcriptional regulator